MITRVPKIEPSKEIIVCRPDETQETSKIIASYSRESDKPEVGIVIKIGRGKLPIAVKVNDRIVYRKFTDNKVMIDGVEFNFIAFKDILGVIK